MVNLACHSQSWVGGKWVRLLEMKQRGRKLLFMNQQSVADGKQIKE